MISFDMYNYTNVSIAVSFSMNSQCKQGSVV